MTRAVGYFASEYPSISHTFIRREIAALRRRGLEVRTFSVRRPPSAAPLSEIDRSEERATHYLLPPRLGTLAAAHARAFAASPARYFAALGVALRNRPPGARALLWSFFYFAEGALLADALRAAGVSHLHVHFAYAAGDVARVASALTGIPWSLMLHGTADFEYPAVLTLADKLRAASFTACASWFVRAQALRTVPTEVWDRVVVVRCGVSVPPEPRKPNPGAPLKALCVGRMSPEKGHSGLLRALARTRETRLEVVFVGDGPTRAALESEARELGLADRVHFLGARPEEAVIEELANADLFVLPSLMEGLPVSLMEAMALGIPVVAPHVAGIPELVMDGRDGLLFPPSDWDALGTLLARLLSEPGLRERLGAAGRARVTAEFAIDRVVEPLWKRLAGDVR